MNESPIEQYNELKKDDFIWYIYIFIVFAAIYSNRLEEDYVFTKNEEEYKVFHTINIIALTVVFFIYIFFVNRANKQYKKNPSFKTELNLIAMLMFLVAGAIVLYLEIVGPIEDEIAI